MTGLRLEHTRLYQERKTALRGGWRGSVDEGSIARVGRPLVQLKLPRVKIDVFRYRRIRGEVDLPPFRVVQVQADVPHAAVGEHVEDLRDDAKSIRAGRLGQPADPVTPS